MQYAYFITLRLEGRGEGRGLNIDIILISFVIKTMEVNNTDKLCHFYIYFVFLMSSDGNSQNIISFYLSVDVTFCPPFWS